MQLMSALIILMPNFKIDLNSSLPLLFYIVICIAPLNICNCAVLHNLNKHES